MTFIILGLFHIHCTCSTQHTVSCSFHCAVSTCLISCGLYKAILIWFAWIRSVCVTVFALYWEWQVDLLTHWVGWEQLAIRKKNISVTLISTLFLCPTVKAIIRHQMKGWTPLTYHYHTLMSWNTWTYHNDMYAMIWSLSVGWSGCSLGDMYVDSSSKKG